MTRKIILIISGLAFEAVRFYHLCPTLSNYVTETYVPETTPTSPTTEPNVPEPNPAPQTTNTDTLNKFKYNCYANKGIWVATRMMGDCIKNTDAFSSSGLQPLYKLILEFHDMTLHISTHSPIVMDLIYGIAVKAQRHAMEVNTLADVVMQKGHYFELLFRNEQGFKKVIIDQIMKTDYFDNIPPVYNKLSTSLTDYYMELFKFAKQNEALKDRGLIYIDRFPK